MQKLLVIDDEEPMRRLLRLNLSDSYEVIDTGDPEQALALAMQNKPAAILLDLRMPKFSNAIDSCLHRQRGSRNHHHSALQGPWRNRLFRETHRLRFSSFQHRQGASVQAS